MATHNYAVPRTFAPAIAALARVLPYLLALVPPLYLIGVVLNMTVDLPYADQWALVPLLDHSYAGALSFGELWAQHNEHRLLFPRLLMLGLARLTGWNTHAEMLANIALAGCIFGMFAHQLRATANRVGMAWLWLLPVLSLVVFSLNQAENWWSGWNMQIFLTVLAASAAIMLLSRTDMSWRMLAAAVACGVVANYSYGTGLLVWPIGALVLAAHIRKGQTQTWLRGALWLGAGALATAAFFASYWWSPQATPLAEAVRAPGRYLLYMLTYLGAAPTRGAVEYMFGVVTGDTRAFCNLGDSDLCVYVNNSAVVAGMLGLALFTLVAWCNARRFGLRLVLPYLGLALYILATAAMTSLGRASFGNHQALAQRYMTTSSLFWLALVAMLALYAHGTRAHGFRYLALGAIGVIALSMLMASLQGIDHFLWQQQFLAPAREALLALHDDAMLQRLYFDPAVVRAGAETLREHQLSVFR